MYNVEWKDVDSVVCMKECDGLANALVLAKELNRFVTINCNELILVGIFGSDSIKNNVCPDGIEYTWKKRRK